MICYGELDNRVPLPVLEREKMSREEAGVLKSDWGGVGEGEKNSQDFSHRRRREKMINAILQKVQEEKCGKGSQEKGGGGRPYLGPYSP